MLDTIVLFLLFFLLVDIQLPVRLEVSSFGFIYTDAHDQKIGPQRQQYLTAEPSTAASATTVSPILETLAQTVIKIQTSSTLSPTPTSPPAQATIDIQPSQFLSKYTRGSSQCLARQAVCPASDSIQFFV